MPNKISKLTNNGESYDINLPGLTVSSTELNYCQGLTANVQDQIDALNSIEIGGRNLFLDTGIETSNNEYLTAQYAPAYEPMVAGETYTCTICITPASGVTNIRLYTSLSWTEICGFYGIDASKGKQIISKTFVTSYYPGREPSINPAYGYIQIYRNPNDGTVTENTTIHWFKIEKGNKSTDWTPAPEDMATKTQIDDSKMLGWTVPTKCPIQNYVDVNGLFHQRVSRVNLGDLNWGYENGDGQNCFFANLPGAKGSSDWSTSKANAYCNMYTTENWYNTRTQDDYDKTIAVAPTGSASIRDANYTDTTAFKNAMQGVYLYYELAQEVQTSVDGNENRAELLFTDEASILHRYGNMYVLNYHVVPELKDRLLSLCLQYFPTQIICGAGIDHTTRKAVLVEISRTGGIVVRDIVTWEELSSYNILGSISWVK